jgi:hypothetical protein
MFAGIEGWGEWLGWLAAASALMFAVSILVIPLVAARIPADYFCAHRRGPTGWRKRHPGLRLCVLVLKNVLGLALVLAGVLMLFLPGQGLLTIFLAIMLMDFPGKYRLERYIISRGPVLRGINWLRQRSGVAPLVVEERRDGC